jgi:hypothetical protein
MCKKRKAIQSCSGYNVMKNANFSGLDMNFLCKLLDNILGRHPVDPITRPEAIDLIDRFIDGSETYHDVFDCRFAAKPGQDPLLASVCEEFLSLMTAYEKGERAPSGGKSDAMIRRLRVLQKKLSEDS